MHEWSCANTFHANALLWQSASITFGLAGTPRGCWTAFLSEGVKRGSQGHWHGFLCPNLTVSEDVYPLLLFIYLFFYAHYSATVDIHVCSF